MRTRESVMPICSILEIARGPSASCSEMLLRRWESNTREKRKEHHGQVQLVNGSKLHMASSSDSARPGVVQQIPVRRGLLYGARSDHD